MADFVIEDGVLIKAENVSGDVVIPEGVTSIGEDAFANCTGLTSITIPDSVTSIEYGAFAYCTGLTSITIPDSVTSIGDWAFAYCTGLTSITIPDSVTSMEETAFNGCAGLTSINIPKNMRLKGMSYFIEDDEHGDKFFDCPNLKEVKWDSPVRLTNEMFKQLFSNCPNIEKLICNGQEIDMRKYTKLDTVIENFKKLPIEEQVVSLDDLIKNFNDVR